MLDAIVPIVVQVIVVLAIVGSCVVLQFQSLLEPVTIELVGDEEGVYRTSLCVHAELVTVNSEIVTVPA